MSALFDLPDDLFPSQPSPLYARYRDEAERRMRYESFMRALANTDAEFAAHVHEAGGELKDALRLMVLPFVVAELDNKSAEEYMLHPPQPHDDEEALTDAEWLDRQGAVVQAINAPLDLLSFLSLDELSIWTRAQSDPDPVDVVLGVSYGPYGMVAPYVITSVALAESALPGAGERLFSLLADVGLKLAVVRLHLGMANLRDNYAAMIERQRQLLDE